MQHTSFNSLTHSLHCEKKKHYPKTRPACGELYTGCRIFYFGKTQKVYHAYLAPCQCYAVQCIMQIFDFITSLLYLRSIQVMKQQECGTKLMHQFVLILWICHFGQLLWFYMSFCFQGWHFNSVYLGWYNDLLSNALIKSECFAFLMLTPRFVDFWLGLANKYFCFL